jgi:hypothetical protein
MSLDLDLQLMVDHPSFQDVGKFGKVCKVVWRGLDSNVKADTATIASTGQN